MAKRSTSKAARDNRTNQLNPVHPAYDRSRGVPAEKAEFLAAHAKPALDNHANQLNPDNDAYERSRGMSSRSVSHFYGNPALARELLHWAPRTGIHEGLARLIKEFQAERGAQECTEVAI